MGLNTAPVHPWISVATAAVMMACSKRQALRLLARRNEQAGGRLLRRIGDKRMPSGVQASKFLVSTAVLHEIMRPDDDGSKNETEAMRIALVLTNQKVEALRRLVGKLLNAQR